MSLRTAFVALFIGVLVSLQVPLQAASTDVSLETGQAASVPLPAPWVSEAESRLHEQWPAPPEWSPDFPLNELHRAATARTISIASFNIQVFGRTKAQNAAVMQVLAQTVARYDVVAIQEIRDSTDLAIETLEAAVDALGVDYEYAIGPRVGRTSSKEQYAFMYRTAVLQPLNSATYNDPGDRFEREPFMARFKLKKSSFDFVLVNVHVSPGDATAEIDVLPTVIREALRLFPGEKDVIVLGDYNADCSYYNENDLSRPLRNKDFLWLIGNEQDTTVAPSSCTYDRIVVTSAATRNDFAGQSGVFDFTPLLGASGLAAKKVSDHFPVFALFYTSKDRD